MYFRLITLLCLFQYLSSSCQDPRIDYPYTDLATEALIPMPKSIEATHSGFGLRVGTFIEVKAQGDEWDRVASHLSQKIGEHTYESIGNSPKTGTIELRQVPATDSSTESYTLDIQSTKVTISASHAEGAFRAVQTLLQLIPETPNDTLAKDPVWVIPTGRIVDRPHLAYRGMMLDVARHFFSVDEVKRLIDILAYYKYNTLHMHLSDDQGWRIEIKSWPKLATVGSKYEVGGGLSSYYTQKDFKEIVRYATERYIQIVPEIDMPGHTNAASVSYPELNGNGKPVDYYTKMKVGFSTLDTRKEIVYKFVDDVVREISAMSPSPFFHIGGDESLVTQKDDYIYFVNRVQKIVNKHGKRMIGWNEIAQASLEPSSVAQFWSKADQTLSAARQGAQVIMSPSKKAYLDMKYNNSSKHGLTWSGYITISTAYNWDPETYITGLPSASILGIEAPLWSETIDDSDGMEYLAFPRAIAYAELGWTRSDRRSWDGFRIRLGAQTPYLNRHSIQYYKSPSIPWKKVAPIKKAVESR